ncbi:hypothetical protein LQ567_21320 [Niabella pedocola]|uniref:Alpha galactosidase C-terminal domain-containing protein n=1 Tax=Niabella pedocola TaxID=1752077 RepID=A0ABS8PW83_9BACT|nr:hypothetical protein [Niabella pedocola]MCD2425338.1 hypothetical protein [Niabella pedocola]
MSGEIAVALFNRSKEKAVVRFQPDSLSINAGKGYTMRDIWSKKDYARSTNKEQSFEVPPHGVVVLRIKGTSLPYNVFQYK